MAATTRLFQATGAAGATTTNVDAGASGTVPEWGTDDAVQSSTAVDIPTSAGTNYSRAKLFYINVTGADTGISIDNRRVKLASSLSPGLRLWAKLDPNAPASYTQGTVPTASGSNDASPGGSYSLLTTSDQVYDPASATASAGRNGDFLECVLGASNLYTAGAGTPTLPQIQVTHRETPA